MSFNVTILGSGAALPTFSRNPTSQYIVCNDRHILIDCGEGTQIQMRKYGVKFQRITHILISHLHGDHYFGLVGLLSTMHLLGRDQGIKIYGPIGLENIIRNQLELGGAKLDFSIEFRSLDGKSAGLLFEDKLIEIHTFPLKHRIPTNGFLIKEKQKERILLGDLFKADGLSIALIPFFKKGADVEDLETGKIFSHLKYTLPPKESFSYAFCSDTVYSENIIPYIKDVTYLYHEATFLEKDRARAKATFHSTAMDAAKIALKANVKKLLLGHLSARFENGEMHEQEAKSIFINVQFVEDGKVYIISEL
ncbi:MAG: ribonuclease Z [Flavobacteriia bacterium]|nr:ribonuclease Z [Flavobacteriia bacterium]